MKMVFAQAVVFSQPIWFLLAIPVVVVMIAKPASSLTLNVLRALTFITLIFAITEPMVQDEIQEGTLYVLLDRSQSMPSSTSDIQQGILKRLNETKKKQQKLKVISFGDNAAIESGTELNQEVGSDSSRLDEAIRLALLNASPDEKARFLVVSDGGYTHQNPASVAYNAAARSIPIDYRFLSRPISGDLGVVSLDYPVRVEPNEVFSITAWIQSPLPQEIEYELFRGNNVISSGKKKVPSGTSSILLRDILADPQTAQYELKISKAGATDDAQKDPIPENNRAYFLVQSNGKKPVLIITEKESSPLRQLLELGGVNAKSFHPNDIDLNLATLSGYSGVIIENVPHQEIGDVGIGELTQWVTASGGGVLLTGGQRSYGQGGYYESRLEKILPVSMELRKEYRKASMAIVLILDRSGSMAMPVAGGKSKMDLANMASAKVVEMMASTDEVGVLAVDVAPHVIVDLKAVTNKQSIRNKVLRIQSQGGGIYVYAGLEQGVAMLSKSKANARHMILFADAADAEQPGNYKKLLADCEKAGITCSVIALGTNGDPDAGFLMDVAKRGNGRSFFTTDAKQLPQLFAQDTFTVARSFIDQTTPVSATPGLKSVLSGWNNSNESGLEAVGGYNLTYLRDKANLAIVTNDENRAPLFASWFVGMGRAACYTGQIDGKYTGPIAKWDSYPGFLNSMARWISDDDQLEGKGFVVTQRIERGEHVVTMHLDLDASKHNVKTAPIVQTLTSSKGGNSSQHAPEQMKWLSPHRLEFRHSMEGAKTYLSNILLPEKSANGQPKTVRLAPVTPPYPAEFQPTHESIVEQQRGNGKDNLQALSQQTGGRQRLDMKGIWDEIPTTVDYRSISSWLFVASIVFLLCEVFERRTGLIGEFQGKILPKRKRRANATSEVSRDEELSDEIEESTLPSAKTARRSWFGRGKKKSGAVPASSNESMAEPQSQTSSGSTSEQGNVSTPESSEEQKGSVTDALSQARARSKKRMRQ